MKLPKVVGTEMVTSHWHWTGSCCIWCLPWCFSFLPWSKFSLFCLCFSVLEWECLLCAIGYWKYGTIIDFHRGACYEITSSLRRVSRLWTLLEVIRHGDSWGQLKIGLCFEMAENLGGPEVEFYGFKVMYLDVKQTTSGLVMTNINFQFD